MSFKFLIGVLFGLLVTGISVLGIISLQNSQTSNHTSRNVKHSHEVLNAVQESASLYRDLLLEGNAFSMMQGSTNLSRYNTVKDRVLENVKYLRFLTRDNKQQQGRIDTLADQLSVLVHVIDLPQHHSDDQFAVSEYHDRFLKQSMQRILIEKTLNAIKKIELELLLQRERANQKSIEAFYNTFFLMLVAIFALITTTFFSIRYNFNKRIKAETELKKVNVLFKSLFSETPVAMVISRLKDGVMIDCNTSYAQLTNYAKEDLIGETALSLGLLPTTTPRDAIVKKALSEGKATNIEIEIYPKDRPPIWVSLSTQIIEVDDEKHLLSAMLDMTAHKDLEEKMKDALDVEIEMNKMKSNFVTLASHEFRTPLTSILSSTFLLERYAYGEHQDKASKHVARIKSSVNNLTSILDEFLSISKIEEGKVTTKIELVNIRDYLQKLCVSFQNFTKPGQQIVYDHHGDEQVQTDPVLLGNIINNLISNAIKYSNEGEKIFISTDVNSKFHIEVKDQGIGIPGAEQQHLFDRFFRASNTGTIQGTGLGLHIMKHYVNMLSGNIQIDSEAGKGSTFTITFDQSTANTSMSDKNIEQT